MKTLDEDNENICDNEENNNIVEEILDDGEILLPELQNNEIDCEVNIIRLRDLICNLNEVTREDQANTSKRQKSYSTVKFNDVKVKCLIDMGAQISALTKNLYDKLVEKPYVNTHT